MTTRHLATFDAVVDTLLPATPGDGPAWTSAGSDLALSVGLPRVFDSLPHDSDRRDLALFLRLLDSPAGGLMLYGLGHFVELMLGAPGLSAVFYVPSALSVPVNAVIGAAWLGLKTLPGPF